MVVKDDQRIHKTAGLETADWILNAQNNLHQATGKN
jgi:hypothetical protein